MCRGSRGGGEVPHWARVRDRASDWWEVLGFSEIEVRMLRDWIRDGSGNPE